MIFKTVLLTTVTTFAAFTPLQAQTTKPAPVADLVKSVDIPYQQFTLKNGLRVVVHTDRKAPIVAVSMWYDVGSKFEPKGKTGFAHLFEHLMFNGSQNAPGDFYEPLKQVGATDFNGSTYFDRTNYFETVPTAALDRALFLESDRMGYLLPVLTPARVDKQRGVVQNEKRQGDTRPYGLMQYKVTEGLFPAGHPYGHTTIGSMADLDAASIDDVKDWFRSHYGPNNAVLVLAGDIAVATAKTLVEKYFGGIPAGPTSIAPPATIPTLTAPVSETIKDRVAAVLISRHWAVPGLNDKDAPALDVAAAVLGGLSSSRLDNALVKKEKLFVNVSVANASFAQVGTFEINGIVRPGVDPALAAKRLDDVTADFLRTGPTEDEVQRVVTGAVSNRIRRLESVGGGGGKAVALAEGALYSNDPGFYKKRLLALAAQTPASVKAAADTWLTRPAYSLTVVPGARDTYVETVAKPVPAVVADVLPKGTRGPIPAGGTPSALTFPTIERTRLSNGIEIVYANRTAVPVTQAVLSFDAGVAADVPGKLGTQALTLSMLDEGTTSKDAIAIAEAKERLGMQLGAGATADRTIVSMNVPSANLVPAVDLFADVVRNPAFADAEVARLKNEQLAQIQQELTDSGSLAARVMPRLVPGAGSPYAKAAGSGDPVAVAALTRTDLVAFQQAWLRPDKAKFFVVSDRSLGEVKAALEAKFGNWKGAGAGGTKSFAAPATPSAPKIVLVDRPDSPQSLISGMLPTELKGTDDLLMLDTANDALGGDFLSRINMDLREAKHWAYGAGGGFQRLEHAAPYSVRASVQADKTGPSLVAMQADVAAFVGANPMTPAEFDRTIAGATRSLAGDFETSRAVLGAMQQNDLFKRPDDYYATITQRYASMALPRLNDAIRKVIDPAKFVWVVVGDAKTVKPQLDSLRLPVEVVSAASVAGAK